MIRFNKDTELTIVEGYDEKNDNITKESTEVFKEGEPVDATIVNSTEEKGDAYVDLQFGDGSVAFGVQRICFEDDIIP
jgi:hypothetical protein